MSFSSANPIADSDESDSEEWAKVSEEVKNIYFQSGKFYELGKSVSAKKNRSFRNCSVPWEIISELKWK